MGEQKPLGETPLGGNPSPEITYLPIFACLLACMSAAASCGQSPHRNASKAFHGRLGTQSERATENLKSITEEDSNIHDSGQLPHHQ